MNNLLSILPSQFLIEYINHTQALVALIDAAGNLLDWNPAFERSHASQPETQNLQSLLSQPGQVQFETMLKSGKTQQALLQLFPTTDQYPFDCLVIPLPGGNTLFFAEPDVKSRDAELVRLADALKTTLRDLEVKKIDLESVLAQAHEVSHTDSLTFLPNRKLILADLQREVLACERYHKPLTIFMTDLDNFKQVNDTYGHDAGDRVLRAIASGMQSGIREIDELGRYGGEEFLFILPDTNIKASLKMANRIVNLVRELSLPVNDTQAIHLTISIGIAQYRTGKETWDELLKRADRALYASKNNGRDQWTIANEHDPGTISSRSNPRRKSAPGEHS